MKKLVLMISAATMAIAMPALAQDNGKGNGKGGGKPQSAQSGKPDKGDRGRGNGKSMQRMERDDDRSEVRRDVRGQRDRAERVARVRDDRDDRWDDDRFDRDDDDRFDRDDDDRFDGRDGRMVRGGDFCPPGLAKKGNGCLPPGQAKKVFARGERLNSDWYDRYNLPLGYRSLFSDNDDYYYRYDDGGYIYRVDRGSNLVAGLIPLLGGGFAVGQPMPIGYSAYNLPMQYRDTYYDSDDAYYRYGDNAIYRVDPQSRVIESVVALLTGDTLGVGQRLPANYDVYNVPYGYRDRYYDNDQYMYRYADGNIYQVDPQTQIISAIISALV